MGTIECQLAIDRLSAYIADPALDRTEIETALSHVRGCPNCTRNIGYLVRALETEATDRLRCADCQERMVEYYHAVRAGQAGIKRWRAVALHLALCPHCALAYADLGDLVELAEGQGDVAPQTYPAPNLSFLRPPIWRWDTLGRLVIAFSKEVLHNLQMPAGPTFALKGEQPETLDLRPFTLIGEVPDRDIRIEVEQVRGDPARCTITVQVRIPSLGGWPKLRGTHVTLKHGDIEIDNQTTDAHGNAVFMRVAVDDLAQLEFAIERGADI
jgi:hypothetical protein